ncbi:glycoside hydrolase family 47 protein [Lentithecium fluviatile CBS 122367]|uniref:alpha-1,2-Mannosidase n=1 Tax=Lentithecium fluviatile CBS 122367 TaxID=1168545 RepID=A0A6G1J613_9PLEO|nr:glycoside hydrolase family 47 protein [Lentithecium fluviatile CBS 122367]
MALLKRFGVYTFIAACFLYLFCSLGFPYQSRENNSKNGGKAASHYDPNEPQQPERPTRPDKHGRPQSHEQPPEQESINWANVAMKHPVESMIALPTGEPSPLPPIQHRFDDEDATSKHIRETRQEEVKKQFLKCWKSYREKAWMNDELKPISGGSTNPFGGWAATLIDALDTLWIMGFEDEFKLAIGDIEKVDFGRTTLEYVNVFETNIRHLGGLLAAYELSGEKRLLVKAKEIGEMLYHAFDTADHMPISRWNMRNAAAGTPQTTNVHMLLAELGSFTLEFTRLSQLTSDSKWYDVANRITWLMEQQQMDTMLPGMWPIVLDAKPMDLTQGTEFTLASMADSAYEYLPKTYALLGGIEPVYKDMYEKAMMTAIKHTLYRPMTPENADMLGTGIVHSAEGKVTLDSELQHLSCYTGGMFALGGMLFQQPEHVYIGRKLTDTCVWAYKTSRSGIMPEVSHLYKCKNPVQCKWDEPLWTEAVSGGGDAEKDPLENIANLRLPKGFTAIDDRRYILRPEAIESVFVMYRITGEQRWQAAAWDMWTAIQSATDTEWGNSALMDVSAAKPPRTDSMESFWMAETLKYFYLVFSTPDTISLDDYVFNTEAHPLKIMKPKL